MKDTILWKVVFIDKEWEVAFFGNLSGRPEFWILAEMNASEVS
jgi:hypothetical protein